MIATYTYWIKKNTDGEDAWEEVKVDQKIHVNSKD